ncbi:MAG: NAD(P)-binding protein [Betaproteobacteria bacterium]|nr:NAD(P)-binding protein [Betaproteobacteria bacterium]
MRTVILGAGVAGLSCSYHIGHERCLILEARPHWGGHAANIERNVERARWDVVRGR